MAVTEPPMLEGVRRELRSREIAGAAYRVLWHGRDELLRVAAVPFGLILMLKVLASWVLPDPSPGIGPADFWSALLVLLSIPLGVLMAVNWLRALVLGGRTVPGLGLRWGRRETRFLLRWLAICLAGFAVLLVFVVPFVLALLVLHQIGGVPEVVVQLAPLLIGTVTMPIYAVITLRLSLALVTAATEAPGSLRDSWMATRGLGGRLLLAGIAVVGPFYLLAYLAPPLLHVSRVEAAVPLSSLLLQVLLAMLTYAAGLALVSVIYRRLLPQPQALPGEQA